MALKHKSEEGAVSSEVAPPKTDKYVRMRRKGERRLEGGLDDLLSHLWSP